MDCGKRPIERNLNGCPSFEFHGNQEGASIPSISSLEVTKMLDEGSEGYVVNVVDPTVAEVKLEEITVLCNFPKVFSRELFELPRKRE